MGKALNATLRGLILQSVQLAQSPAVLQKGPADQVQPRESCPHSPPSVGFLASARSPSGRASWKKQTFHGNVSCTHIGVSPLGSAPHVASGPQHLMHGWTRAGARAGDEGMAVSARSGFRSWLPSLRVATGEGLHYSGPVCSSVKGLSRALHVKSEHRAQPTPGARKIRSACPVSVACPHPKPLLQLP